MHKNITILLIIVLSISCTQTAQEKSSNSEKNTSTKEHLAHKLLIADTHIDAPYRIKMKWQDLSEETPNNFDFVKARKGGLDVAFMSIYIPASYQETGGAKLLADSLIDMMEGVASEHPDKFRVVHSTKDIENNFGKGTVMLAYGIENGAAIENNLNNLRHFYDRGVRYITLTHSKCNRICDSSFDNEREWNGLSDFGQEVVKEMNRLGIMIDVSHISDSTFYDVMEVTKSPVIASHSSCRKFTPGFERNMSDEMIRKLAENGGVIQINFGSGFINNDYSSKYQSIRKKTREYIENNALDMENETDKNKLRAYKRSLYDKAEFKRASLKEVADHIDHVVKLAGIDHVGLGSDYDGVGPSLPIGLEDVSTYPALIDELQQRGYSEEDIKKICSGNLMRVWKEVEKLSSI